eukprot:gene6541-9994_t
MSSKLARFGIKKVVTNALKAPGGDAAAPVMFKRKLASASKFPKGEGTKSSLSQDDRLSNIHLVAGTAGPDSATASGTKLSALQRRMEASKKKEILILTEDAGAVIKKLIERRPGSPVGIKVGVQKKGCSGLGYTMDYLLPEELDEVQKDLSPFRAQYTTQHGVTVLVQPDAFMHVVGTVMDYHIDKAAEKFVFTNPNAEGACGCGESFVPKKQPPK